MTIQSPRSPRLGRSQTSGLTDEVDECERLAKEARARFEASKAASREVLARLDVLDVGFKKRGSLLNRLGTEAQAVQHDLVSERQRAKEWLESPASSPAGSSFQYRALVSPRQNPSEGLRGRYATMATTSGLKNERRAVGDDVDCLRTECREALETASQEKKGREAEEQARCAVERQLTNEVTYLKAQLKAAADTAEQHRSEEALRHAQAVNDIARLKADVRAATDAAQQGRLEDGTRERMRFRAELQEARDVAEHQGEEDRIKQRVAEDTIRQSTSEMTIFKDELRTAMEAVERQKQDEARKLKLAEAELTRFRTDCESAEADLTRSKMELREAARAAEEQQYQLSKHQSEVVLFKSELMSATDTAEQYRLEEARKTLALQEAQREAEMDVARLTEQYKLMEVNARQEVEHRAKAEIDELREEHKAMEDAVRLESKAQVELEMARLVAEHDALEAAKSIDMDRSGREELTRVQEKRATLLVQALELSEDAGTRNETDKRESGFASGSGEVATRGSMLSPATPSVASAEWRPQSALRLAPDGPVSVGRERLSLALPREPQLEQERPARPAAKSVVGLEAAGALSQRMSFKNDSISMPSAAKRASVKTSVERRPSAKSELRSGEDLTTNNGAPSTGRMSVMSSAAKAEFSSNLLLDGASGAPETPAADGFSADAQVPHSASNRPSLRVTNGGASTEFKDRLRASRLLSAGLGLTGAEDPEPDPALSKLRASIKSNGGLLVSQEQAALKTDSLGPSTEEQASLESGADLPVTRLSLAKLASSTTTEVGRASVKSSNGMLRALTTNAAAAADAKAAEPTEPEGPGPDSLDKAAPRKVTFSGGEPAHVDDEHDKSPRKKSVAELRAAFGKPPSSDPHVDDAQDNSPRKSVAELKATFGKSLSNASNSTTAGRKSTGENASTAATSAMQLPHASVSMSPEEQRVTIASDTAGSSALQLPAAITSVSPEKKRGTRVTITAIRETLEFPMDEETPMDCSPSIAFTESLSEEAKDAFFMDDVDAARPAALSQMSQDTCSSQTSKESSFCKMNPSQSLPPRVLSSTSAPFLGRQGSMHGQSHSASPTMRVSQSEANFGAKGRKDKRTTSSYSPGRNNRTGSRVRQSTATKAPTGKEIGICLATGIEESLHLPMLEEGKKWQESGQGGAPASAPPHAIFKDVKHLTLETDNDDSINIEFEFDVVAPEIFRDLRYHAYGVSDDDFYNSISSQPMTGGRQGEGKSGMLFFFSWDKRYIAKTTDSVEVPFFFDGDSLEAYHKHLRGKDAGYLMDGSCQGSARSASFLPRFSGFYGLKFPGEAKTYLIVFENIFPPGVTLKEKYDLKGVLGSKRYVSDEQRAAGIEVLKDRNFLNRTLHVGPSMKKRLAKQLTRDVHFLEERGRIDYSLLLAVADLDAVNETPHADHALQWPTIECRGLGSTVGEEVFLFGVIDILQEYSNKKAMENLIKSTKFGLTGMFKSKTDGCDASNAVSAVPPSAYAKRFLDFLIGKME